MRTRKPHSSFVRVAAVLSTLGLLSAAAIAPASGDTARALPALHASSAYVTGISSGGFMAEQLQVAYSAEFSGAGIFAAGPYDCGQGTVIQFETCDLGITTGQLENQAQTWASQGRIDPLSNLQGKPVYTYHGLLDPVVNTLVADAGVSFNQHFGARVTYHDWDPAGHGWPSPTGVLPCSATTPPFLINCLDDPEGEMLRTWFGAANAPNTGTAAGTLSQFDQTRYAPGGNASAIGINDTGYLYTPAACTAGGCKVVVALHGCASDQAFLGDAFAEGSFLNQYADTNHLVVLYPQTVPTAVPVDPQGCWDWFGYDGSDFAVKSAPQMVTIMNMVAALKS